MRQVALMFTFMLLVCIGMFYSGNNSVFAANENDHDGLSVDFGYMPPEWQTAICLPDDPFKSIVDKSGDLLYHYLRIKKVTEGFRTQVRIQIADDVVWENQELHSPRVPIVRTYLSAKGLEVIEEAFAVTDNIESTSFAKAEVLARNDVVLIRIKNTASAPRIVKPQLAVYTEFDFDFRADAQQIVVNNHETITASLKMKGVTAQNKEYKGMRRVIQLESLSVPAGKTETFFIVYSGGDKIVLEPNTLEQVLACRDRAVKYWENVELPYGFVEVPDAGIQDLIDSSIRNIWQAREFKDGLPAFQVGPTMYRSLWIVDGAFLLETAT
ncbi:MAG: hypothetical protein ACYTBV_03000, partial [Planctomycetota bacterium]